MTWLAWRQFRGQAVTATAALAVFAVLLAVTGPHLASEYASSGIGACHGGRCQELAGNFLAVIDTGVYPTVYLITLMIIILAPAVTGIFWGAPLIAREYEAGTFRLAWTQSVTRLRWLAAKITLAGLAAMAVCEALSLLQGWWAAPIDRAARLTSSGSYPLDLGPFNPLTFATHGITPLGYAAFGFALGCTTGVLIRRTVPAMAITLAVFAAVQVAFPLGIRPHLFPPGHASIALGSTNLNTSLTDGRFGFSADSVPGQPGAWIISSGAVNAAGAPVSSVPACAMPPAETPPQLASCLARHGVRVATSYEPASRYWPIQGIETAVYLVLAMALAGYCFWYIGRRRLA
ncbi:MAG TPA: ABC transporter permease subunit [Streptosporangiaceae bacterium]|jgi:hypothetical protein